MLNIGIGWGVWWSQYQLFIEYRFELVNFEKQDEHCAEEIFLKNSDEDPAFEEFDQKSGEITAPGKDNEKIQVDWFMGAECLPVNLS